MTRNFASKSNWLFVFSLLLCLFLAACGGGGGSSGGSSGGGTSSGGSTGVNPCNTYSGPTQTANNVMNVSIDCAVFGNSVNEPFVSVTVCSALNKCLTIDHILVDTGSVGLRLFAKPANGTSTISSLGLSPLQVNSMPVGECLQFVQGSTWGQIMLANVTIGPKVVNNLAIQVIGDSSFNAVPQACSSTGTVMSTSTAFGANGVLGIGLSLQDCGQTCTDASYGANIYFNCQSGGSCNNIGVALASQVQNPVSKFGTDNNGVILSLPNIAATGAAVAGGTLTFGIDTQTNNVSTNTNTILVDGSGNFTTTFEGQTYSASYIDSGSNGLYFSEPTANAITQCASTNKGFYCPTNTTAFSAVIQGQAGSTAPATVSFNIANATTLFANGYAAFNNLAGTATDTGQGRTFDFGLPFFYGRNVFVAFEKQAATKAGTGPYFGF
ncbi:hypothetical protein AAKU67_000955 [Oxalobacteraceae bacterium GrIS 2.11]